MDPFADDARRLCEHLHILNGQAWATHVERDAAKLSAVTALCQRLENVLRVVDGQDISRPFDGRMMHREAAAAITKLDEVRLWAGEHLRVRAMVEQQQAFNDTMAQILARASQPQTVVPMEGKLGEEGSYKITEGPFEMPPAAGVAEKQQGSATIEYRPWTPQEIEIAKEGELNRGEPPRNPPPGFDWDYRGRWNGDGKWQSIRYLVREAD